MKFQKLFITIFSIVNIILFIFILALQTNWFRYNLSLESSICIYLSLSILIIYAALSVFLVFLKNRFNKSIYLTTIIPIAFLSLFSIYEINREEITFFYTKPWFNDVVISIEKSVVINNITYKYHFEFVNPFSNFHKEYIIIKQNNIKKQILIPFFVDTPAGITNLEDDSFNIRECNDCDTVILEIDSWMRKGKFEINLYKGTIEETHT